MVEIYKKTNTNYKGNGDITLVPTVCTYKDSEKELVLEHPFDKEERWKYIEFENVIAAEENGKKKLFRIYNVVRSLYSVTAYAKPIFYDLIDKVLLDVRPTNKLGKEALNIILADTPFTGHSNLTTLSTSYYVRKNIVEALLGDDENSFLNRWGGEFYCENFDVYINDKIGSDNGIRVEFGYNLNEIEEDVNIENVATRIIPVGFDGIMLEGNTPWVDSPLIAKYTKPKMRVIKFEDVKVKEKAEDEEGFNAIEEARAELIKRCNKLYESGIDKPVVNYKIDMINLANTTEYEDFKMLVDVNKGDTVTCCVPNLDIDVKARVIDYDRDMLTGEYISIELGNAVKDFFKNQSDMQNKVDNILNSTIDSNGNLIAEKVKGFLDATKTKLKAQRQIGQLQDARAFIWEDLDPNSPSFGCMVGGSAGIQISQQRTADGKDWDFTSAFTAEGIIADKIVGNLFSSKDGSTSINMNNGEFRSKQPDGSEVIISPANGFYNKFGSNKREYHHLSYSVEISLPACTNWSGYTSVEVQLPDEFRNKLFVPTCSIKEAMTNNVPSTFGANAGISAFVRTWDYANAKIVVDGVMDVYDFREDKLYNRNQDLKVTVTVMA